MRQLLVILLLAMAAGADPAGVARRALVEAYQRMDKATQKHDADAVLAFRSADFVSTDTSGAVHKLPESVSRLKRMLSDTHKIVLKTRVQDVELRGSTAIVQIQEHFEAEFRHWMPGRPSRLVCDGVAQDEWVRTRAGWRLKSSTELKLDTTAGKKKKQSVVGYIRVLREGRKPIAMQTAVWRFRSPSGQSVDLVAAVHMAEKSYYQQLNREFTGYQGVLYELIAPHSVPDEEGRSVRPIPVPLDAADNPLSAGQLYLTRMLGLHFQLNEVDYSPNNFIHADLSPDELVASMTRRGESAKTIFAQVLRESLANSAEIDPADAMALNYSLTSIMVKGPTKGDQMILRRVLASSFRQIEKMAGSLEGPNGSTLLAGRNEAAIQVLKRQLNSGRRRLAIFYGAAHMADLEKRLLKLGFTRRNVRFIKAWNLR